MKTLRRILFLVLLVVTVFVCIGFLLPEKAYVKRSLLISSVPGSIFKQVNTLKNWEKWSPWLTSDSLTRITYSGSESGEGASFRWNSIDKNIGNGSLSINYSFPYDSLMLTFDFSEKGKLAGKFIFEKQNHFTKVTWSIESDLGNNPVSRWFGLFVDQLVGPDLEKGLLNLRELMASSSSPYDFEVVESEVPSRVLLSIRDTASPLTLTSKLASMFGQISVFLKSRNLSPTGNPIAIYHAYSSQYFDIEACMPVAHFVKTPTGMFCVQSEKQNTVMVNYLGSNSLITGAYSSLQSYIADKKLQVTGPPWEEYINNPNVVSDSNKWQTNIYFPVR